MVNILINGIGGTMGKKVYDALAGREDAKAVCGVDKHYDGCGIYVPIYQDIRDVAEKVDCIIDFSVKAALYEYLPYAVEKGIPCVIATTGYGKEELDAIQEASKKIPIFRTGNLSLGVNVLTKLVKQAAALLGDKADIEIIESHHNKKVDAPSGTALMLLDSVKTARTELTPVYGRQGQVGKRAKNEIGIHSVRGGSIVGKHEVMFILDSEVITLTHEAESKTIFANGSINAAIFLQDKPAGLYSMADII
jgi:4-hydroxy-tetrahydrodipicolinate reductase